MVLQEGLPCQSSKTKLEQGYRCHSFLATVIIHGRVLISFRGKCPCEKNPGHKFQMIQSDLPDVTRLQPTPNSLNIILKNTHFKDEILATGSKIHFRIAYSTNIPVLIFKFPEPYYDFLQVLSPAQMTGSNQEWLNKSPVLINLVISNTVIADCLSTRAFSLDFAESENLKAILNAQKDLPLSQIRGMEEYVYANGNIFLA